MILWFSLVMSLYRFVAVTILIDSTLVWHFFVACFIYLHGCTLLPACIGAPTGSGKTIAAEIAMFRLFDEYPDAKVTVVLLFFALLLSVSVQALLWTDVH